VENFSCNEPGSEAQEEIDIIHVGRYSRCGDRHECIIQGDAEDSLCVDALSWLAESIGEWAWHIYSCYDKYRYGFELLEKLELAALFNYLNNLPLALFNYLKSLDSLR
jgi:hypothetical protein